MNQRIDFVMPWVDGNDPEWQHEFLKYKQQYTSDSDASIIRYRDWDLLRYWFRGVEQFAPWVDKIHFITWGHLPEWLDVSHPKLHIVNHNDYIPCEYLPTFSSIPIELNMHRIDGLSDKFVYFNDDTFLLSPIGKERFFKRGLPRDIARLSICENPNVDAMNRHYEKNSVIGHNITGWFNPRYKFSDMLKTLSLLPWQKFYGFKITHMPQPFIRTVFDRMWTIENNALDKTCRSRIRTSGDMNQYLMRYEQLCSGQFVPHGCYDTLNAVISDDSIDGICDYITSRKGTMICLNDGDSIDSFRELQQRLIKAFDIILPEKSSYER